MNKVLVLGANGFIGSHIVDSLAIHDFQVFAYDRFSSAAQFDENLQVTSVKGDIFDLEHLAETITGMDYVFHTFSATTPYTADQDPYADIVQNLLNNAKIFEICAQKEIKKVVYLSSGGAIYGSSAEAGNGAKETDIPLPISPYGITKLATERYLEYFQKRYGLQHVSYRLSNPYGPRQVTKHNQGVVPIFIDRIRKGETITLYGDGSSSRDYIFIKDAVHMLINSFEEASQKVYNVGDGKQTSLLELIKILEELLQTKAVIETVPKPASFVEHAMLDITRFKEEFHIEPETDLREGLKQTIDQ